MEGAQAQTPAEHDGKFLKKWLNYSSMIKFTFVFNLSSMADAEARAKKDQLRPSEYKSGTSSRVSSC